MYVCMYVNTYVTVILPSFWGFEPSQIGNMRGLNTLKYMYTYVHTFTYIHTYICAHAHIHIHTHKHI